ncbi:MAG: LysE family transporter [Candidatus Daviesbacteria bacterium]|nr:LysE family transporter [Candidatus Daviesbacteria bacterium]
MEYLPIILTVTLVNLLAAISPGPDFLMVTRNSLIYSRKTGMYTAVGLGFGILVHVTYSLAGIGLLIAKSILLFNVIKLLGAAYLIYIGYKSLTSKSPHLNLKNQEHKADISAMTAIKIGFITNVTNPKATLFFLSLFTLVIIPSTPLSVKLFMGVEMAIVVSIWFILVAYLISHHLVRNKLEKVQHSAEKFIGVVLIVLGIKVALSTSK